MSSPAVSVLMTCYNRQKFIEEAISSVLDSDFPDFELIISDDGSTDESLAIAGRYAETDKRVIVSRNSQNLGDYPNRNKAASIARGEFIMFCDSDDKFFPSTISYCVEAMRRFPQAGIGMYYAGKDRGDKPVIVKSVDACRQHFFEAPFLTIGPGGTILRKTFFDSIHGYPVKYGPANDMYFNLKAASQSDILLLPWLFLFYRIHDSQEQNNLDSYKVNNFRYLRDAIKELNLPLNPEETKYVTNKNRRRFISNFLRTIFFQRRPAKAFEILRKSGFQMRDLFYGIFHT
ncbi:MAG: glycosyltransferase family 2 protein [Chitinophagaceae bacterium]|nr:glycosyltransferase family 2 protein [Bacteroidota bacterium]MCC6256836.1 glycosyltransferase family 2 protein [Chitinophagaceae bacterium]MCW5916984.1 glycosyltransferase family 2 protein [Ferruginibacter sp.]